MKRPRPLISLRWTPMKLRLRRPGGPALATSEEMKMIIDIKRSFTLFCFQCLINHNLYLFDRKVKVVPSVNTATSPPVEKPKRGRKVKAPNQAPAASASHQVACSAASPKQAAAGRAQSPEEHQQPGRDPAPCTSQWPAEVRTLTRPPLNLLGVFIHSHIGFVLLCRRFQFANLARLRTRTSRPSCLSISSVTFSQKWRRIRSHKEVPLEEEPAGLPFFYKKKRYDYLISVFNG